MGKVKACVRLSDSGFRSISFIKECVYQYHVLKYKTIGDGGITVDVWIFKVHSFPLDHLTPGVIKFFD